MYTSLVLNIEYAIEKFLFLLIDCYCLHKFTSCKLKDIIYFYKMYMYNIWVLDNFPFIC